MQNAQTKTTNWFKNSLGLFQILIGLGAMLGGGMLVADPTGQALGMSVTWLDGTPFTNYLIPGLTLLLVNGLGTLIGSVFTLKLHQFAGEFALALGTFMILWITIQVSLIGYMNFLQPLYFVVGIVESVFGLLLMRSRASAIPALRQ